MSADLLTKGLDAPAAASPVTVVKLAPEGLVTAIVAVTGVVDAVEDLIVPGAFAHTLKVRRPKVVFQHQWTEQVGRVLHVEEWMPGDERLPKQTKDGKPWPAAAGALVATMQFNMRSPRAAEQWEMVRFYAETNEAEFSIGYKVPDGKARKRRDGVRVILQVDLYEFSHVLFGAAPLSMALDVKSAMGMHSGSADTITRPALVADDEEFHLTEAPKVDPTKPWDDEESPQVAEPTRAPIEAKSAASVIGIPATEEKSMTYMSGSFEERTELIRDAARDLFCKEPQKDGDSHTWVCVRATFPTEVIVTVEKDGDEKNYLIPYTIAEDAVALEAPTEVELSVVAKVAGEPPAEDEEVAEALHGQVLSSLIQVKSLAAIAGVTSTELIAQAEELYLTLGGKSAGMTAHPPKPEEEVETLADAPEEPPAPAPAPAPPPAPAPAVEPEEEETKEVDSAAGGPAAHDPADTGPDKAYDHLEAKGAGHEEPATEEQAPEEQGDEDPLPKPIPAATNAMSPVQHATIPPAPISEDSEDPAGEAPAESDTVTIDPDEHFAMMEKLGIDHDPKDDPQDDSEGKPDDEDDESKKMHYDC